jgi:predicted transposase YbfD/YdcC
MYEQHSLDDLSNRLDDPRNQDLISYSLGEIFFLVIAAMISNCNKITEVAVFGASKLEWLRRYYPYEDGAPSHDTIGRVLSFIKIDQFEAAFIEWVSDYFDIPAGELVSFDGKRIAGSADKLDQSKPKSKGGRFAEIIVNVFACGAGLTLAQTNVTSKMDETSGAIRLLESLDLAGCCVSGDSNFCGRNIIDLIIERKADYLLALKGKSPKLLQVAKAAFQDKAISKSVFTTEEQGRGRYEKRVYRCINVSCLDNDVVITYNGLQQIIEVVRQREITRKSKVEKETHYYITSLGLDIESLSQKIRGHWLIENRLHHTLDVQLGEDDSRSRKGNQATSMSIMRKTVLNLMTEGGSRAGIKHKRLRASFSDTDRDTFIKSMMR